MGIAPAPRRPGKPQTSSARRPRAPKALGGEPRRVAAEMVLAVCEEEVPLSAVMEGGTDAGLSGPDQALVRAIVRATVRRRGDIDHILSALMQKKLPKKAGMVRAVLRISAAQLLFMRQADHAAVNVAVDLLKSDSATGGFAGLANAVLRRLTREREDLVAALPVAANTPDWLFKRWVEAYGADDAAGMAQIHRTEPPLDLALAPGATPPPGAIALPTGGVRLAAAGAVEQLEGYADGGWWVQDVAAQLPAQLLGDVTGQHVLDMCAAPGGKTMQLAAAGARVTAVEVDAGRADRLRTNLARTGLADRVEVRVGDAAAIEGTYDAVLLDAPCSSTGTLRRQPDVAWSKSPQDIGSVARSQRALLAHAATLVEPGGKIVLATCSLERQEGEAHLGFVRVQVPQLRLDPITEADGMAHAFATDAGTLRTLTHLPLPGTEGIVGLDGFFAARFVRQ
ncbi:transcription antitermination factor NusB [Acuticoccus sp. MNP-M23]|uniref:RsmB/NOP family class I SAM-dependent RNA methyltransferase n=1 Tax=Acuticoccus sp. MNP-M23 TaxID=3072793 RepID=UPI002816895F|nr:transcription antitermination factor NusB [Acuticoccus sp. MNP-M23]WMS42747.1 transcription antitermination factor NusB [Acuticoccus sp. MNP-M23]